MKHVTTNQVVVRFGFACSALAICSTTAFAQATESAAKPPFDSVDVVKALKEQARAGFLVEPAALGDFSRDNVYTALTPCRLLDTRIAGGKLAPNVTRTFDADGSDFVSQGGNSAGCGVPYGQASSIAVTIHVVTPSGGGAVYAWGLGTKPIGSVINYVNLQTVSNNAIIPIVPGVGNDFSLNAQTTTDVAVDVVGYFAAPLATALQCTNVASAVTTIPYNAYTPVDAVCAAGYTATGGGTYPTEGTLGRPGIWTDGSPTVSNGWRVWVDNQTGGTRTIQAYAVCCRVPGR